MKTLSISDQNARKIYASASPDVKSILEDSFGKDFFSQKITDRIKTFEDACHETDEDPNDPKFSEGTADEIAYKKMKVIVKALNEKWEADWNKSSQPKWRPWFYLNAPGFRFSGTYCADTFSFVGSRLCFKSEELCKYAANQFLELYKDLFTA